MLGSRVVLGWVMVVGVIVGLPIAAVSPGPATLEPSTLALLGLAGICYVVGLQLTYAALRIGKVSIVAPIVATEGAVAALIAVALGDTIGVAAGLMLAVIAAGVVLSHPRTRRAEVPAGDFDIVADALDGPATETTPRRPRQPATDERPIDTRRAALLSIVAALVFGLGLVAAGKAAALVPVAWVALSARLVGHRRGRHPAPHAAATAADPRRVAAGRHRGRRRGPRVDALGVGLARQHRDRRRDGQPVRGDRRGGRATSCSASGSVASRSPASC